MRFGIVVNARKGKLGRHEFIRGCACHVIHTITTFLDISHITLVNTIFSCYASHSPSWYLCLLHVLYIIV